MYNKLWITFSRQTLVARSKFVYNQVLKLQGDYRTVVQCVVAGQDVFNGDLSRHGLTSGQHVARESSVNDKRLGF